MNFHILFPFFENLLTFLEENVTVGVFFLVIEMSKLLILIIMFHNNSKSVRNFQPATNISVILKHSWIFLYFYLANETFKNCHNFPFKYFSWHPIKLLSFNPFLLCRQSEEYFWLGAESLSHFSPINFLPPTNVIKPHAKWTLFIAGQNVLIFAEWIYSSLSKKQPHTNRVHTCLK